MDSFIEFCQKNNNRLEKNPKSVSLALGIFFIILIACIDYLAIPDLSLAVFYLFPVAFVTWFVRPQAWFAIPILSTIIHLLTSLRLESFETNSLVSYWNAVVVLIFLLTTAYLIIKLRSALEKEKDLACIDSKTGVANERLFLELAKIEIQKVHRYRHPITIIYIDIDDFTVINKTFGNKVGDNLLKTVAETLKNNLRETDIIARIGGDEFVILLAGSGYEPARTVIYRVQNRLLEAMKKNEWPTTFSIGAVTFINPPKSVDDMIERADHLVYLVKNKGKNQLKHSTSV